MTKDDLILTGRITIIQVIAKGDSSFNIKNVFMASNTSANLLCRIYPDTVSIKDSCGIWCRVYDGESAKFVWDLR